MLGALPGALLVSHFLDARRDRPRDELAAERVLVGDELRKRATALGQLAAAAAAAPASRPGRDEVKALKSTTKALYALPSEQLVALLKQLDSEQDAVGGKLLVGKLRAAASESLHGALEAYRAARHLGPDLVKPIRSLLAVELRRVCRIELIN